MQWLIVAMGILLMLVGTISVISGAPIIQIERGWAEVIAGAVAVSGGAITFAIGTVLFRLQAWQQAMVSGRVAGTPVAAPAAAAALPETAALRPTREPTDTLHVSGEPGPVADVEAVETTTQHPKLWRDVPPGPPSSEAAAEPGMAPSPADTSVTTEQVGTESLRLPPATPAWLPEPTRADIEARPPRRLNFPPSDRREGQDDEWTAPARGRDWMNRPLLRPRAPQPPPPELAPPLFAGPAGDLDDDRAPAVQGPRGTLDPEHPAEPTLRITPDPLPTAPAVEIVGRYQAGTSSYTMFSNGSIDVETESGDTHHFASMDELKAFIARQENTVS